MDASDTKRSFFNTLFWKPSECVKKYIFKKIKKRIRTIYINNQKPKDYENVIDSSIKYKSNRIITSKYNIITFLPKNLFEQFKRIANFYFLTNVIIQFCIPNPPTSPYGAVVPLIVVILVTAIKQGKVILF